jgi:hypothetical protein
MWVFHVEDIVKTHVESWDASQSILLEGQAKELIESESVEVAVEFGTQSGTLLNFF